MDCPNCGKPMGGVEYPYGSPERYDGVSEWVCLFTGCSTRIGRWSGKPIPDGAIESRYDNVGFVSRDTGEPLDRRRRRGTRRRRHD